jgi:hypothetical protein
MCFNLEILAANSERRSLHFLDCSKLFVFVGLRYRPKQPDTDVDGTLTYFITCNYTNWMNIRQNFTKSVALVLSFDDEGQNGN